MSHVSKSPWIIHYDGSSCNGCDIEVLAALTPLYDVERFGIINTGNPKHADIFLVTGGINERNISVTYIPTTDYEKTIVVTADFVDTTIFGMPVTVKRSTQFGLFYDYFQYDLNIEELYHEYERLLQRRKELRELRKLKIKRVSEMIRAAWLNRNTNVGRSNTGSVTDSMLLSLPTPPTSTAIFSSLESGGVVSVIG